MNADQLIRNWLKKRGWKSENRDYHFQKESGDVYKDAYGHYKISLNDAATYEMVKEILGGE